jgi:tetratricopeptide (TPR) repeat protein
MKRAQSVLLVVALLFSVAVHAKTASEVFDAVSPSIVVIRSYDVTEKNIRLGSGVATASNVIVTNCHVTEDAVKIEVVHGGKKYSAALRYSDWDRDVCSLTVSGINAQAVVIGSTGHLKVGARVYAIGAPQGLELTLSEGIISSLRQVDGGQYIQITAPISPGSSGGGLFDEEGRLIGLPTFYLAEGQQLNFAVPVEWISELPKRHKKEPDATQNTAEDWINKAVALHDEKDWTNLKTHSLRWTKAQPKDADAWFVLGFAYEKSGEITKSIKAYEQARSLFPEYAGALYELGWLYLDSDETLEKAKYFLQKSREINPAYVVVRLIDFGYTLSAKVAREIASCQEMLRINPENAGAWFNLGEVYRRSHENSSATDSFRQVVRINPEDGKAWYYLGVCYGRLDQTSKATEAYRQAVRIDPGYARAWYGLGLQYKKSGQTDKTMEAYNRLKTLDPALADRFFNEVVLP